MEIQVKCWICDSQDVSLMREGISPKNINSNNFKITDPAFGSTLSLYECNSCKFQFCPTVDDVVNFYEALVDEGYEETRSPRELQANKLLETIALFKSSQGLKLLDIGAGSGILVEQANKRNINAIGVEPSHWLANKAKDYGLQVINGIFPNDVPAQKFDIITLIDVLEHVTDPLKLLQNISEYLADDGVAVIATPDVGSIAAKILGKRWWHYRIAHIGYFKKSNLKLAVERSGMQVIFWKRPVWFFPIDYILVRLDKYLPFLGLKYFAKISEKYIKNYSMPLNLADSWLVIIKKR